MRATALLTVLGLAACSAAGADGPAPDPLALLRGVEQARLAITSGRVELRQTYAPANRPKQGPDEIRLVIVFNGDRRKVDESRRVMTIHLTYAGAGEAKQRRLEELGYDREAFVREGLATWHDSHVCTIQDGARVLTYSDDGRASIFERGKTERGRFDRSISFDPRILGLSAHNGSSETVRSCLSIGGKGVVSLVGREEVAGKPAWHVRGEVTPGFERHLWVEPPPGHRVYKFEERSKYSRSEVVSEYDDNPLPIRVSSKTYNAAGALVRTTISERKAVELPATVGPETWTLAGLGMPVGTSVSDESRPLVGYWDGKALSEKFVAKAKGDQAGLPQPDAALQLRLARRDPKGLLALDALATIGVVAPSGPEAREALTLLAEHHAGAKGVGSIALDFFEGAPEGVERLLRAVLEKNANPDDQAFARYGLGRLLKEQAERTGVADGGASARLLEAVASADGELRHFRVSGTLKEGAATALSDLRTLSVGKPAPGLVGEDLGGQPLSLEAYRGKVVVVVFWATWCGPCLRAVPHERELVARLKDRPFAMIGVSGDDDRSKARDVAAKESITWPTLWQGDHGSITQRWGVHFWPTLYVLDGKGVIRFKNVSGKALDAAVESLLDEGKTS